MELPRHPSLLATLICTACVIVFFCCVAALWSGESITYQAFWRHFKQHFQTEVFIGLVCFMVYIRGAIDKSYIEVHDYLKRFDSLHGQMAEKTGGVEELETFLLKDAAWNTFGKFPATEQVFADYIKHFFDKCEECTVIFKNPMHIENSSGYNTYFELVNSSETTRYIICEKSDCIPGPSGDDEERKKRWAEFLALNTHLNLYLINCEKAGYNDQKNLIPIPDFGLIQLENGKKIAYGIPAKTFFVSCINSTDKELEGHIKTIETFITDQERRGQIESETIFYTKGKGDHYDQVKPDCLESLFGKLRKCSCVSVKFEEQT